MYIRSQLRGLMSCVGNISKPPLAVADADLRDDAVHLSVCLSVCLSPETRTTRPMSEKFCVEKHFSQNFANRTDRPTRVPQSVSCLLMQRGFSHHY